MAIYYCDPCRDKGKVTEATGKLGDLRVCDAHGSKPRVGVPEDAGVKKLEKDGDVVVLAKSALPMRRPPNSRTAFLLKKLQSLPPHAMVATQCATPKAAGNVITSVRVLARKMGVLIGSRSVGRVAYMWVKQNEGGK